MFIIHVLKQQKKYIFIYSAQSYVMFSNVTKHGTHRVYPVFWDVKRPHALWDAIFIRSELHN